LENLVGKLTRSTKALEDAFSKVYKEAHDNEKLLKIIDGQTHELKSVKGQHSNEKET
jgi:hypothetical protein